VVLRFELADAGEALPVRLAKLGKFGAEAGDGAGLVDDGLIAASCEVIGQIGATAGDRSLDTKYSLRPAYAQASPQLGIDRSAPICTGRCPVPRSAS
jgi:hypothetical protein